MKKFILMMMLVLGSLNASAELPTSEEVTSVPKSGPHAVTPSTAIPAAPKGETNGSTATTKPTFTGRENSACPLPQSSLGSLY